MGETRHIDSPPKRDLPPIPALNWAPPEVLASNAHATSYVMNSDIYSLTIVLMELLTLNLPFGDDPELVSQEIWYNILFNENLRPNIPINIPTKIKDLITKGWDNKPSNRPSALEFKQIFDEILEEQLVDVSLSF